MPWEVGTMSELRWNFVQEVLVLKRSISASCRKYGISRKTGYKWLVRHRAETEAKLVDRSRRPRQSPRRTAPALEEEILQVRDRFGWGAPKIWAFLRNAAEAEGVEPGLPSERTIGNVLRRHGRVTTCADEAATPPQFFERSQPHELWQCDFKGPLEVERRRVHPFTVLDDHSRFLLALQVCWDVTMASAWNVLWSTFGEYGLPESLLCDGAFAGGHAGVPTLSWIEGRLIRLGIRPVHGRAYHPQTQGKVERLHGTLEREVWPYVDTSSQARFGAAVEQWRCEVYNPLRPHEALSGRPPLSRFALSPRVRPATLPAAKYPAGTVLRKVSNGGDISWSGYRILVGAGLTGEAVRVEELENSVCVSYLWKEIRRIPHGQLVRERLL
jgi:transposase InsO family protein